MTDKIKQVFLNNGYEMMIIDGREVFVKENLCYRIDFAKKWNEYIIEFAESIEDAERNLFEDSEFIPTSATDKEIEEIIANCIG